MVQLTAREILLDRLYTSLPLFGLDDQYNALSLLIAETVNKGKGNSAILQGPTGSGKTRLIKRVLSDLRETKEFYTIFLDGIVHTDDKVALHSIIRQLHLNQEEQNTGSTGTFADRLRFMLTTLARGGESSIPIVFILDRFDMFAEHTNQILLYNLFDIAQSHQTPICVIGVSGKLDSIAMLEKRVKSRFSHRIIDIYPLENLGDFHDIARSALFLKEGDQPSDIDKEKFNNHVESFLDDPSILEEIKYVYTMSRHVPSLLKLCSHTIQELTSENHKLSVKVFTKYASLLKKDQKCGLVQNLCVLELGLLGCIKKYISRLCDDQSPMPTFNFEIIFDEYQNMVASVSRMGHGSHGLHFKKAVVLKGFEQLESIKLIKFEGGSTANVPKEYRMARSLLTVEQIEQGLEDVAVPHALAKWMQTK